MTCTSKISEIDRIFLTVLDNDKVDYLYSSNDEIYLLNSYDWQEIDFLNITFKQKRTKDQKGTYFQKTFEMTVNDFMSEQFDRYEEKKIMIIFRDHNNRLYVTGHERPYVISKFEGENSDSNNELDVTIIQNSYRTVESLDHRSVPQLPFFTYNSYVNFSSLFDTISTGATIAYWIKFNSASGEQVKVLEKQNKLLHEYTSDNSMRTTYYSADSSTPVVHDLSYGLDANKWYFVVDRVYKGFFPMTIEKLVFNTGGTMSFIDQDQKLTDDIKTGAFDKPFQLYRNNRFEIKRLAIYSRPLIYNAFLNNGEIAVLLNGGNGLDYEQLDGYSEPLFDRLIAYYDEINFNDDIIEDKHTNNLNLYFNSANES